MSEESLKRSAGNLGVSFGSNILNGAKNALSKVSDIFGFNRGSSTSESKHEFLKLKQIRDTDWTEDKEKHFDEHTELPKFFSWKEKKGECLG